MIADRLDVCILLVHYSPADATLRTINSLKQVERAISNRISTEILVVSNTSDEPIPIDISGVRQIRLENNRGFGAGVNRGVQGTAASFICVLNPDVELDVVEMAGFLRDAMTNVQQSTVPMMCAARVRLSNRLLQDVGAAGPGLLSLINPKKHPGYTTDAIPLKAIAVQNVSAVCILFSRLNFLSIGGFDEGYFLYFEDADLCRRWVASGWSILLMQQVVGLHSQGLASEQVRRVERERRIRTSQARYYAKHFGHVGTLLFRAVLLSWAVQSLLVRRLDLKGVKRVLMSALKER